MSRNEKNWINIVNNQKFPLDTKVISEKVLKIFEILKDEHHSERNFESGALNIIFETRAENRRLNKTYRRKKIECTSLTFVYPKGEKGVFEADVVVNYLYLKKLHENDVFPSELDRVIVHAILHVMGFDHEKPESEKKMNLVQEAILKKLK